MKVLENSFHLAQGYNTAVNPFLNKPGECRAALNCDFSEIGTVTRFQGYEDYGNAIAASSILGLYDFKTSAGSKKWLAVNGTVLYRDESGTWTSTHTGLTTGKQAEFCTHLDTCIMVNGTDAAIKSTDGVTWSALGGSPPVAKYVVTFNNSVYMLNVSGNTSRMQWSDDGTIETWTATNIQDISTNIGIGDQITGGTVNNNALLIFKNYSVWRWDTYELLVLHPTVGCRSPRSIATLDEWTFWLSHKGVYATNGGKPFRISNQIRDFIDGISDITGCVGWVEDNFYYLYIGTSNSVTNCLLIYDYDNNVWSYKSLGVVPKIGMTLTTSGNSRSMYFGDSLGQVYKFKTGNNDDGNPIPFKWLSPSLTSAAPYLRKDYQYLYIYLDQNTKPGIDVFYSVDYGDFEPLGKAYKVVSELSFPEKTKGHNIRIVFASNHSKTHPKIYGYTLTGDTEKSRIVGGIE